MAETYRLIKTTDPEYPEKFKNLPMMPSSFYLKGRLPDHSKKAVAIVGARKCSTYGQQTAEYFASALAGNGIQIISGLALGTDSYAHKGCMKAGGSTFAVMGCGIERIYPKSNTRLYRQIIETGGGIISEFDPSAPPLPYHFPIRNRLISALSDAVIIIEAEARSGSLITASYALEQGVPVYAVPGRINDRLSSGTNELIKQGAFPAVCAKQIAEDMGIRLKKEKEEKTPPSEKNRYSAEEQKLLDILSSDTLSVDDLCRISKTDTAYLAWLLLKLELEGAIYSPFPGSYARTHS